jgi:hypothetical protein
MKVILGVMIKIIDNRKVDLTQDEWNLYVEICRSYDKGTQFKGENLFVGLFESDDNGQIVFLRPPSDRYTSMEAICYIQNIMLEQSIRQMNKRVDAFLLDIKSKVDNLISNANKKLVANDGCD